MVNHFRLPARHGDVYPDRPFCYGFVPAGGQHLFLHEGFRKDYFLSNDYIDKFTKESLLLNIPPIRADSQVVDIDGHKIGKVKKLHRNPDTTELESIEVTDGLMHSKIISKSHVWGVGEKVILKITKDQYKRLD